MPIGDTAPTGLEPGASARLAELAGDRPPASIAEVLARLTAIRDHAGATSARGPADGIAVFTGVYHDITALVAGLVDGGRFAAPGFLDRLEIEFAERYFAALRRYTADAAAAPTAWRVLFDNRSDPAIPAVNFAVAGVNAHLNLDLAGALVSTWEHVPPDDGGPDSGQYHDYCRLNDVFETTLDPMRDELRPPAVGHLADLVVRFTRDLAWDEAREVWTDGADEPRRARSTEKLDTIAAMLGARLLTGPSVP